jgi:5-methylcytosine-specific restriction protein B
MGKVADVPWIGIFSKNEKASARQGFYPVYLFRHDGSAVYLALACATEDFQFRTIRKRALDIKTAVGSQFDLLTEIDLRSMAGRPKKYQAATAFARKYDAGSIPDNSVLRQDLERFIELWQVASAAGLELGPHEQIHIVLKWSPDREPQAITLSRAVAERQGSVWWGCLGGRGTSGMASARLAALHAQLDANIGPTYAYLYRRGECWRTEVIGLTSDQDAISADLLPGGLFSDLDRRLIVAAQDGSHKIDSAVLNKPPGCFDVNECGLFVQLKNFQPLDPGWPMVNLVPIDNASPEATAGALGNQSTPLAVFERFMPDAKSASASTGPARDELTLEWLERETLLPLETLQTLVDTLKGSSPQIILAGPPGTSKTWIAERIARYVTHDDPLCRRTVQFHPSYGYEEFMEGLRPVVSGGGIIFDRVDGVVLEMAKQIRDDERWHVLIMDEMNRANLPRVLGELMYLFEYRNQPLDLRYTKNFELPENLLFIGTMNTADRSIRGIDIALRRRFEVFEFPYDVGILGRFYKDQSRTNDVPNLLDGFVALNDFLKVTLDRHHTIGHSFFMAEHMTHKRLKGVWDRKIAPLIEEYFFDQPQVADNFLFEQFWPKIADANPVPD